MNLPNKITIFRLIITVVYFIILAFLDVSLKNEVENTLILDISTGIFIIACITDLLDGYLARKLNMQTTFGRMIDPFADKILIGGSFIYFVHFAQLQKFLVPWMVIIIIGREFLVTAMRSYAESKGISFGSKMWGKHKMVLQSVTVIVILLYLGHSDSVRGAERWIDIGLKALIWLTLVSTVLSAIIYAGDFAKIFRKIDK